MYITDSNNNIIDTSTGQLVQAGNGPVVIAYDGMGNLVDSISGAILAPAPANWGVATLQPAYRLLAMYFIAVLWALLVIFLLVKITKAA